MHHLLFNIKRWQILHFKKRTAKCKLFLLSIMIPFTRHFPNIYNGNWWTTTYTYFSRNLSRSPSWCSMLYAYTHNVQVQGHIFTIYHLHRYIVVYMYSHTICCMEFWVWCRKEKFILTFIKRIFYIHQVPNGSFASRKCSV